MKLSQYVYGYVLFLCVGPVILASPSTSESCGNVSASDCLKDLKTFLHLTSLPYTSDKSKLESLCNTVSKGYNCSQDLMMSTKGCLSDAEKVLFPVFLKMAEYTMFMLCKTGPFDQGYLREEFLENSDCILKQMDILTCCAKESNLNDLPVMYMLDSNKSSPDKQIAACCPTANYIKCVKTVVHEKCGVVAGNLTVEYIRRSSGEQVEKECQNLRNYPDPDPKVCKTPAPVCDAACKIGIFMELTVVLSFLLVTWITQD